MVFCAVCFERVCCALLVVFLESDSMISLRFTMSVGRRNKMTYINYDAETPDHTLADAPLYFNVYDLECYIASVEADECCSLKLTPELRDALEDGELLEQIMDNQGISDYDMESIASDIHHALSN